ncbi:superoxide dismutase [Armatimonas sp.]|uniref:superoxide dismutase n=1 Tax=Armatimonas sp. TaxID=1872638 RepID=UPI003750E38A
MTPNNQQPTAPPTGPFSLPVLTYPPAALEPHIDAQTMQIHHGKHHQAYITNLNMAVAKVYGPNSRVMSAEALLKNLARIPEDSRMAVRNNAGGHANHTIFWTLMKPNGGGAPTGAIADAIKGSFGDFDKFKAAFEDAGLKRFGSGWVWLSLKKGKLELASFPYQDTPLLEGGVPILGNDVWEHAYYLKYQNKRIDYLKAWWNVVNWDEVNNRLKMAR